MRDNNKIQLGVGGVVFNKDMVLLVKRKNPPCQDQWAIPGGKVNFGESLKRAVKREISEETGIEIEVHSPIYTFEIIEPELHYVVIDFTTSYLSGELKAADDAAQAAWISREDFPTLEINPITKQLLKNQFQFP
ncbi:MAG: NUDIX hydrolase [Thioalkalispiraceae bacterium]|jgi:8-oxo-dGTP diphosphatase